MSLLDWLGVSKTDNLELVEVSSDTVSNEQTFPESLRNSIIDFDGSCLRKIAYHRELHREIRSNNHIKSLRHIPSNCKLEPNFTDGEYIMVFKNFLISCDRSATERKFKLVKHISSAIILSSSFGLMTTNNSFWSGMFFSSVLSYSAFAYCIHLHY